MHERENVNLIRSDSEGYRIVWEGAGARRDGWWAFVKQTMGLLDVKGIVGKPRGLGDL